jgi:Rad3-related DNA helicase
MLCSAPLGDIAGKRLPDACASLAACWCVQAFHTLYHTDENVLLGAPTGSGKTISSELTLLRLFTAHPGSKVVYIAPLKVQLAARPAP